MDTYIHQILGTSIGTRMAPPYANLFMEKEERTIILTFLHLIYFWKRFIDDIFFIFLGSHCQLKSLMTFMNTTSPIIKCTFTHSKQTATFLDVKIYLSKNRKLKPKLYRKPTDCMTLLHFHSHHPLSCKEGIIYSKALRYNMIISEDHILQAELNLTRILLARSYPLHLIIKNIKKSFTHSCNYLLSQRTPHRETNILPIITPFSDIGKQLTAIIHRNWEIVANDTTLSTIWPSKPLSAYTKSTVFITTLLTLHKHMVPHSKTPRTTTHTHPHTPIRTYPPHIATVVTPVFFSILDTPNSSWCHEQWTEHQDIPPRFWYHPKTSGHTNAPILMLLIWEVQSHTVNVNIFSSSNIALHNL